MNKFIVGERYKYGHRGSKWNGKYYRCNISDTNGIGFIASDGRDLYYSYRSYPRISDHFYLATKIKKVIHWK